MNARLSSGEFLLILFIALALASLIVYEYYAMCYLKPLNFKLISPNSRGALTNGIMHMAQKELIGSLWASTIEPLS